MLRLEPDNLNTVNNLANLYIRNKQQEQAVDILTNSISKNFNNSRNQ